jgi:hypothetical protein
LINRKLKHSIHNPQHLFMKAISKALFFFLTLAVIAACKKSSSQAQSSSITGNWNFISEQVQSQSTTQYNSSGVAYKTITVSNYITSNDSGIVSITANMMNAEGLTYLISGTAFSSTYQDGQFIDSTSAPINYYVPPTSSSSSYNQVNADSIYFSSGGFANPSGYQSTGGNGAKINISGGSQLTLTSSFTKDSSIFLYGMPATINYQATLITTLRR